MHQDHPGRDSDSVGLGCALGTCIVTESPGIVRRSFGGLLTKHMVFHLQEATGLGGRDLSSSPQWLVTQWNWLPLSLWVSDSIIFRLVPESRAIFRSL